MSKLSQRKTIVAVGKRIPTLYEIQQENKQKALEALEIAKGQNKKVKYLLK
jgi:hypothetical protein